MVAAGKAALPLYICEAVLLRPGNLKKGLPFGRFHDTVPHDPGQVLRRSRMNPFFVFSVQPVWSHKMRIRTAKRHRLFIHLICKILHTP